MFSFPSEQWACSQIPESIDFWRDLTLFSNCQVYFRNQIPSRVKPEAIRIHLVIGPDLAGVLGAGGREEERVRERERERERERQRERERERERERDLACCPMGREGS